MAKKPIWAFRISQYILFNQPNLRKNWYKNPETQNPGIFSTEVFLALNKLCCSLRVNYLHLGYATTFVVHRNRVFR